MNKVFRACLLLLSFYSGIIANNKSDETSQSFMFPRPFTHNLAMRQTIAHNSFFNKTGDMLGGFEILSVYQQAVKDRKFQRYFLFDGKNELTIKGDTFNQPGQRDIRAEYFGITDPNFESTIRISPEQWQCGVFFEYHQDLKNLFDIEFLKNYWVHIQLPIGIVENNLNFVATGDGGPEVIDAFNQSNWCFAKIKECKTRSVGIAELALHLGKTYMSKNHFQLTYYSGVALPTAPRQNPEYLFDSFLGNNGHISFENGVNMQILLNRNPDRCAFTFFVNLHNKFLIRNKQLRTLDLKGKPWSRYLTLNKLNDAAGSGIPAVNVLTQKCWVRPYNMIDFSAGWRFITQRTEFEFGYNVWGHGSERLKLDCEWKEIYGIAGGSATTTASASTISTQAADDAQFTVIKECEDLDFDSAESKNAINHKFHGSFGFYKKGLKMDGFFNVGGFYEWAQKNSALGNRGFWVKVGGAF